MVQASRRLTRRDGSLEEAFPHEGSYCVTTLVAFDLLCTLELLCRIALAKRASNQYMPDDPLPFTRTDETHALMLKIIWLYPPLPTAAGIVDR